MKPTHSALFRFYAELNDFLPADRRRLTFSYFFAGKPSVKDAVEALGVPHTEVDVILVNGESVGFGHALSPGDFVSVYPVFESLDIKPLLRLRPEPLRQSRFVLDTHLGSLARRLRLLGLDTLYGKDLVDAGLVKISVDQERILLTRDRDLLRQGALTRALWLRSNQGAGQAAEVLARLDLKSQCRPFSRCLECNGELVPVAKAEVAGKVPAASWEAYDEFQRCPACGRIYWKGTHYAKLQGEVDRLLGA